VVEPIECKDCHCEFDRRTDQPKLEICLECAPTPDDVADWHCPDCGWNCEHMLGEPDAPVVYSRSRPAHWEYGGEAWTETWTCPECGTEWDFENSSI
jgi:hypothetical protein